MLVLEVAHENRESVGYDFLDDVEKLVYQTQAIHNGFTNEGFDWIFAHMSRSEIKAVRDALGKIGADEMESFLQKALALYSTYEDVDEEQELVGL